jgi:hypothetical protein
VVPLEHAITSATAEGAKTEPRTMRVDAMKNPSYEENADESHHSSAVAIRFRLKMAYS